MKIFLIELDFWLLFSKRARVSCLRWDNRPAADLLYQVRRRMEYP